MHPSSGASLALLLALSGCAEQGVGSTARWYRRAVSEADGAVTAAADASVPAAPGRDAGLPDAGAPDAALCDPESCNAVDDDCDGAIDEGSVCPCDARVLGGRAYLFCDDPLDWPGAHVTCERDGYGFATIEDATEDAAVYAEIAARGWIDTWIGLTDGATEGTWRWSTGDPLAYRHWDAGEPNDGAGGEDCGVIMTTSGRASEWDDRACSSARPYVCEAD